jgi:uncharacterized membrane protein (UPF0127 family)
MRRRGKLMRCLLLPLLLLIPACSPQAAEQGPAPAAQQTAVHPVSGLPVIPLKITSLGRTHNFRVELAQTPQEQARGLMFRTEMGPDEGMIFPYDPPRVLSFWMKNTVLSLDLVFIGPDHRVINIAANAVPYSEQSIVSDAPAIATLELNAGRAKALNIVPGATVEW